MIGKSCQGDRLGRLWSKGSGKSYGHKDQVPLLGRAELSLLYSIRGLGGGEGFGEYQ